MKLDIATSRTCNNERFTLIFTLFLLFVYPQVRELYAGRCWCIIFPNRWKLMQSWFYEVYEFGAEVAMKVAFMACHFPSGRPVCIPTHKVYSMRTCVKKYFVSTLPVGFERSKVDGIIILHCSCVIRTVAARSFLLCGHHSLLDAVFFRRCLPAPRPNEMI